MGNRGTATEYNLGQYNEVLVSMTRALPKALEGTDPKLVIKAMQSGEAVVERGLANFLRSILNGTEAATPPAPATHPTPSDIPADGVEFELTLEPTDALAMVKADGYDPKGWQYKGPKVTKPDTKRVKLIRVGYVRNLAEVQAKAREQGCELVIGQWREAFKKRFPTNDGKGPIGFGGKESSWVDPCGDAYFPVLCVHGVGWRSDFGWSDDVRDGHWRWLAASK